MLNWVRHVPPKAKQPAERLIPFAKVEVAVPVIARVPVAVRLPPMKVFPATPRVVNGEVVPMPREPANVFVAPVKALLV